VGSGRDTGLVVVVDTANGTLKQIAGFPTAEMGSGERKRVAGPSSVTVGELAVYVGNRGDSTVCAFDARSFAKGKCHRLDSMPDGLASVDGMTEVWVTTPRDKSIRILDARTLEEKAKLTFDGNPEGFAVDAKRIRFYTNLEDKDRTLAIDLATHKTVATWKPLVARMAHTASAWTQKRGCSLSRAAPASRRSMRDMTASFCRRSTPATA
jgi:DNA-binding beta-propeller fold protein YncE